MAVTIGTSSGFCSARPTADPSGSNYNLGNSTVTSADTSPVGATEITEVGFYRAGGTGTLNYRVGLYADSAGAPGALLYSTDSADTTATGWYYRTVSWSISGSTTYWLGLYCTGGTTTIDAGASGGSGRDYRFFQQLPDPFGGGTLEDADGLFAVYALSSGGGGGTNLQLNIGDAWKSVDGLQINIGDTWKSVAGAQVNIGDTWKTIY